MLKVLLVGLPVCPWETGFYLGESPSYRGGNPNASSYAETGDNILDQAFDRF
jgi:hypothetical protein